MNRVLAECKSSNERPAEIMPRPEQHTIVRISLRSMLAITFGVAVVMAVVGPFIRALQRITNKHCCSPPCHLLPNDIGRNIHRTSAHRSRTIEWAAIGAAGDDEKTPKAILEVVLAASRSSFSNFQHEQFFKRQCDRIATNVGHTFSFDFSSVVQYVHYKLGPFAVG